MAMAASGVEAAAVAGAVNGEGEPGKCEMEAWLSAGGSWGDNAGLRRVVACAVRALATRGQPRCPRGGSVLPVSATDD